MQSGALQRIAAFKARMAASIIGQEQLIEDILIAYIAGGHVLLEGAPGLAKTLTVRTFAGLSNLRFKRIQFTPDLLPADLTGTLIFEPSAHRFSVRKGPLFAHIILADEITVMLKSEAITASAKPQAEPETEPILSIEVLRALRAAIQHVRCTEELHTYIVSLVSATRPIAEKHGDLHHGSYLSYITVGASPRASIALYRCSKIRAFLNGRDYVIPEDIKAVAYPVLRHRLKLSYEASAENIGADEIIAKLLELVPQP